MTTSRDLTAAQRRMLAFLDDSHNSEDSVVREIEEIRNGYRFDVTDRRVEMGLAEMRIGPSINRSFSAWYGLTDAGRALRNEGIG